MLMTTALSNPTIADLRAAIEKGDEILVATGVDARRMRADLLELRRMRVKHVGGSVFKRPRSRFWQIRYPANGKSVYESTGTEDKRTAQRMLDFKVYEASAGLLPGTATFKQIIENYIRDARSRELRSVPRLERATKNLLKHFDGYRAEQIDAARWLKYLDDRKKEAAADTVHFELSVARRAYVVGRMFGLVRALPEIPRVRHLHVRKGFIEPRDWLRVRQHLQPDLRDACDFALACGAREMEVLTLKWEHLEDGIANFHSTKTDQPRKVPYSKFPQLREVIGRRQAARERLERAHVISPWVFCFEQPVKVRGRVYHHAGGALFGSGEHGLHTMLRENLDKACTAAAVPRLMFHDFRRSAARNFERAAVPRSVARLIGGWSDRIYSRYAIGAESELRSALSQVGDYLHQRGWHSRGTQKKTSLKSGTSMAEGGGSRTLRQQY